MQLELVYDCFLGVYFTFLFFSQLPWFVFCLFSRCLSLRECLSCRHVYLHIDVVILAMST